MRTLLFFLATTAAVAQTQSSPASQNSQISGATALPPLTQAQRLKWATLSTIGPVSLAGGAVTSAWSTWTNSPPEYGPTWEGWAKRQGLRVTGAAPSNFLEAELGALWGEDPRYHRAPTREFKGRVWHVIKTAFLAYDTQGRPMPAYSRYIAVSSTNVLSNTWRPESQHSASEVVSRIGFAFTGRMTSNAFAEFWPDVKKHVFKKK